MDAVGQWVRKRREFLGLTREDVVRMSGLSGTTIVRVERGEGGKNRSTMLQIARALGLEEQASEALSEWAAGRLDEAAFDKQVVGINASFPRSAERFLEERGFKLEPRLPAVEFIPTEPGGGTPILGEVTAGGMVESIVFDPGDEPERVPIVYPGRIRVYALRIKGESMSPEYRPGEILIVQDATPDELEDGEDAVIQCGIANDGVSTFKRVVFLGGGRLRLMPLNSNYKPIECRIDHVARIGKVLGTYRPRKK